MTRLPFFGLTQKFVWTFWLFSSNILGCFWVATPIAHILYQSSSSGEFASSRVFFYMFIFFLYSLLFIAYIVYITVVNREKRGLRSLLCFFPFAWGHGMGLMHFFKNTPALIDGCSGIILVNLRITWRNKFRARREHENRDIEKINVVTMGQNHVF